MKIDQYSAYIFYVIVIVAIVAFAAVLKSNILDLTGQAFSNIGSQSCYESDAGDDPYVLGLHTGKFPWKLKVYDIPDTCRDANTNMIVQTCTNCRLMEYYCRADGKLFWNFYEGVDCINGAVVDEDETEIPSPVAETEDEAEEEGVEVPSPVPETEDEEEEEQEEEEETNVNIPSPVAETEDEEEEEQEEQGEEEEEQEEEEEPQQSQDQQQAQ